MTPLIFKLKIVFGNGSDIETYVPMPCVFGEQVNNAWNEKIRVEQGRALQLESDWKALQAKIEANADTPGYHQAIKHNEIQLGQHKHDGPSTRVCIFNRNVLVNV